MAGVTLGFLKYVLGLDTLTFRKGLSQADQDLAKLQRSFASRGRELQSLGKKMTAFATLPLVGSFSAFAKHGIDEAQRMVNAMAQVDSALKSTGGVAGQTGEELKKAAEQFELHSLFESEDILKDVSARLLAFGTVHGAMFNRAQQDILDYAQRTGKDLGAATVLIGKSLENPAKAAGALFKAGVTLTDGQKELIKQFHETGNAAGAQDVILTALEAKYRGAASAAANADPYHNLHVTLKQLAETIGNLLLPLIRPMTEALASVVGAFTSLSPATQKWVLIVAGIATVMGPTLIAVGNLLIIVSKIVPLMKLLATSEALATAATVALDAALSPIILVLGAVAVAVGAVYVAWKHWDQIKAIAIAVYTAVKTWIGDKLTAILSAVKKPVDAVIGFFHNMWDAVVGHSYVPDTVDAIEHHFGRLGAVMVKPAEDATKATAAAFAKLKDDVGQLLDQLFPEDAEAKQQADNLALLNRALEAGIIDWNKYADARARVAGGTGALPVNLGPNAGPPDQVSGPDVSWLDHGLDGLNQIVQRTQDWKDALSSIKTDLLNNIGNELSSIISGSAKLKDLWRDLLAFGIRELTSSSGPLGNLLSGHRASGGPVLGGSAYLVGERGPEIFMPSSSGRILSNSDSRRAIGGFGGGVNVNVYGVIDANSFKRSERQVARSARRRFGIG